MFAKFAVVACLIGLARAGALQNSGINYGLASGYPGYAGALTGYAGASPGYAGTYPGYAGAYPGYAGTYPGAAGVHPALNGGVATSYINFEKYSAPRPYNAAYNGVGPYAGLNGYRYGAASGPNGLDGGVNGAYGNYGYGGYGAYGNKHVW